MTHNTTFQGKKIKKSVSFKLEPEIETYDNTQTKKVIRRVKKVVQIRRVRQPIICTNFYSKIFGRKMMTKTNLNLKLLTLM